MAPAHLDTGSLFASRRLRAGDPQTAASCRDWRPRSRVSFHTRRRAWSVRGREEDCLFGLKSTDGLCPLHFSSVHFQSRLSRPIYRSRLKIGWWRQGQRTNGLRKMSAWQSALWCVPFCVEITPRYAYPILVFWMTESCCTLLCTETSLCVEALAFWLPSRWRSQRWPLLSINVVRRAVRLETLPLASTKHHPL